MSVAIAKEVDLLKMSTNTYMYSLVEVTSSQSAIDTLTGGKGLTAVAPLPSMMSKVSLGREGEEVSFKVVFRVDRACSDSDYTLLQNGIYPAYSQIR